MQKFSPQPYHTLSTEETLAHVGSSRNGLSDFDAAGRAQTFGRNELPKDKEMSRVVLFLRQLNSPLIFIILAAAGISFVIGHHTDALFILVVVAINTIVGFLQEDKAQRALAALRNTMVPHARVMRGGARKIITAEDLVVGDIVVLEGGDRIPADGRLLSAQELYVNESVLTGEWVDVLKDSHVVAADAALGDQRCMVFAGGHVSGGKGVYVVTATGGDTEIGKIATLVRDEEEVDEPLKKRFRHLSRMIGVSVLFLIAIFALFGFMRGQTLTDVFITSTALVVSAIPEGLLPAVTIVMIFGVRRLVKKRALVRRLSSTETIGAITVICTDKTGTLTKGEMHVSHILTGARELLERPIDAPGGDDFIAQAAAGHMRALEIGGLVNDAFIENPHDELEKWVVQGRPTDKALLLAATHAGIDIAAYMRTHTTVGTVPFSSQRKFAARVYQANGDGDAATLFALGAPEKILERCCRIDTGRGMYADLASSEFKELKEQLVHLTQRGLRVLACAQRVQHISADTTLTEDAVVDLTLVGFIAIKDPVRSDAKTSIERAQRAGIRPVIITGDHAQTAAAIVAELGWYVPPGGILTGPEVEEMSDTQLRKHVEKISIFARVAPEHKIRIVHALQANAAVVAMVGDGVNDAPALKAAHVGISMGNGTDITKGVADIVLLDSSFTTIIDAIEQGRIIFENIRRTIMYLVADDFSELFVFFVALTFGLPLPLVAAQILWINLVEDSLPNIALTTERDARGIMDIPPRRPDEPLIAHIHRRFMFVIFAVSGLAAAGIFVGMLHFVHDIALAQTVTFALIALDSLVMVYVLRSFRRSILRRDLFGNHMINGAVFVSLLLLLAGIYIPPLAKVLHTVPLGAAIWGMIVAVTLLEVVILEIAKKMLFSPRRATLRT